MPKLQDIAHLAGVSKATASLALNGSPRIKEETRRRVIEVANQYHYIPKRYAQTLASGKSGIIGVVTPNVESEFYGKLVRCLDRQIQRRGYTMYLALSNERLDLEEIAIQHFVGSDVEGVVVVPLNLPIHASQLQYLSLLHGREIPCAGVFILRPSLAPAELLPGLALEGGYIKVDRNMATNIPGVFAAGDCTGRPYQYTKAVGEGNVAAHSIIEYLASLQS